MDAKLLIGLLVLGSVFAGQYTEYCMAQSNSCFQANCYKVNGRLETRADGLTDCIYDESAYTDTQVYQAFGTCLDAVSTCETQMEGGGTTYTPTSGGSSSSDCCGSAFILLGLAGAAMVARKRN